MGGVAPPSWLTRAVLDDPQEVVQLQARVLHAHVDKDFRQTGRLGASDCTTSCTSVRGLRDRMSAGASSALASFFLGAAGCGVLLTSSTFFRKCAQVVRV